MAQEAFLIAVPGSGERPYQTLYEATAQRDLSSVHKFDIPELKIGTLDALVALLDDLAKVDSFAMSVTLKLCQHISELVGSGTNGTAAAAAKTSENLQVNGTTVERYLANFHWDLAKFNTTLHIKDIMRDMSKRVSEIETEMKTKMQAFSKVKGNLQAMDRKTNGSLLIRSLAELVKPEHFVLDSEYLVTLLVVVPKQSYKEWLTKYEQLSEYVVPRSSEQITEDNEYGLFTVTMFRRVVDDFKARARELKFVVRDFEYLPHEASASAKERQDLAADLESKYHKLSQWCSVNFGEAFSAWIHLKALRVFVESVLRYGLPVNFKAFLIRPFKGKAKKARQALAQLYSHLDSNAALVNANENDVPTMAGFAQEYYPYVNLTLDLTPFLGVL